MGIFPQGREYMGFYRRIMVILGVLGLFAAFFAVQSFAVGDDDQSILKIADEGKTYLYGSRYQCQLILREEIGTGTQRMYWNAPEIINLTCAFENDIPCIPVYCMDGVKDQPVPGDPYRRINLEDREELGGEAGGRLRAVLLGTYPHLSVKDIENRANEALEEEQVRQLTLGEVLTATQQAIWTIGNDAYEVDRNYVSIRGMSQYDLSQFAYPESLMDCVESPYTRDNIQNLYRYFLEMQPMKPIKGLASDASFRMIRCDWAQELFGTYTVKVSYELRADICEEDELILTVSCAEQIHQSQVKQRKGIVVFMGVTERNPITISLNGYQTGCDVYLYSAEETGPDLIGYDESRLPVNISRVISEEEITTAEGEVDSAANAVSQTETVPIFTVETDKTGETIRTAFRILGGVFFVTAFVMLAICFFGKFRRHK